MAAKVIFPVTRKFHTHFSTDLKKNSKQWTIVELNIKYEMIFCSFNKRPEI